MAPGVARWRIVLRRLPPDLHPAGIGARGGSFPLITHNKHGDPSAEPGPGRLPLGCELPPIDDLLSHRTRGRLEKRTSYIREDMGFGFLDRFYELMAQAAN